MIPFHIRTGQRYRVAIIIAGECIYRGIVTMLGEIPNGGYLCQSDESTRGADLRLDAYDFIEFAK